MTITLQIIGFHNCNGCARKVKKALENIGVELVKLDRESGNVTIASAESPELIRRALERQLNKSVIVLPRDLVPANRNPNPVVAHQVLGNLALSPQEMGQIVLGLAHASLDGVEITSTNTTRINIIHRATPPVVRQEHGGYIGARIRDVDYEYSPPRPQPRSPPWTPSAPLMPVAEQPVAGYPLDNNYYYGGSTCRNHDHPNGCCKIV